MIMKQLRRVFKHLKHRMKAVSFSREVSNSPNESRGPWLEHTGEQQRQPIVCVACQSSRGPLNKQQNVSIEEVAAHFANKGHWDIATKIIALQLQLHWNSQANSSVTFA